MDARGANGISWSTTLSCLDLAGSDDTRHGKRGGEEESSGFHGLVLWCVDFGLSESVFTFSDMDKDRTSDFVNLFNFFLRNGF